MIITGKKNEDVIAIVQARMGSTRLPGKVMKEIVGKPMVWHVFNRLSYSELIDSIVLATSDSPIDDCLERFAKNNEILFFRGSEMDVLGRFSRAAEEFEPDHIVRITSDCPLIDPKVVDKVICNHLDKDADYTSNIVERTYPWGLDTEIFTYKSLSRADEHAEKNYEREHVTPYIRENLDIFNLQSVEADGEIRRPEIRLTVDEKEDLKLIRKIFENIYDEDDIIRTKDVVSFLDRNPEIAKINSEIEQKKVGE